MADTYWLSFRIHEDAGYSDAYEALIASVKKHVTNGKWWFETTSFYVFGSTSTIDAIAASVKAGIRPDRDLVVIGKPDYKTGRVIGKCEDQDIFSLIPFMKKV